MRQGTIIRRSTSRLWSSEGAPSLEKRPIEGIWEWRVVMDGYEPLSIQGRTPEELNANIAKRLGIERSINSA